MATGTVKFFNPKKGFGFITPDEGDKDVYVHITAVEAAGLEPLVEGLRVNFETEEDERGVKAANLSLAIERRLSRGVRTTSIWLCPYQSAAAAPNLRDISTFTKAEGRL